MDFMGSGWILFSGTGGVMSVGTSPTFVSVHRWLTGLKPAENVERLVQEANGSAVSGDYRPAAG